MALGRFWQGVGVYLFDLSGMEASPGRSVIVNRIINNNFRYAVIETFDSDQYTNEVKDNFNRANEGPPPSAIWTTGVLGGAAGLRVVGNELVADAANGSGYLNNANYGPDTGVYVTRRNAPSAGQGIKLYARLTPGASANGYELHVREQAASVEFIFGKYVSGTYSQIGSMVTSSGAPASGHKYAFLLLGNRLSALRDAGAGQGPVEVGSVTDNSHSAAGRVGVLIEGTNSSWDDLAVSAGYINQAQAANWFSDLRAGGVAVGVWGVHHGDPLGDSKRAHDQVTLYDADFYVANAEAAYKADVAGGDKTRAATFVNDFRSRQPTIKAAMTSEGAAAGENKFGDCLDSSIGVYDYKVWYDAGFVFHPQAYWDNGRDPNLTPLHVAEHAKRCNWPLNRTHMIIGVYQEAVNTARAADYWPKFGESSSFLDGSAVSPATTFGFSMFLGDPGGPLGRAIEADYIECGEQVVGGADGVQRAWPRSVELGYADLVWSR